jgi:TusA-related sulfurtransferase
VPCPLTWARVKAFLESASAATVVEVLIDDARSVRDLPAAAEAEGYAVLKTEPRGTTGVVAITIER